MGDLANGYACCSFINAFASDIVKEFRSEFLDRTFGNRVRYYVLADSNWEVCLYAAIKTGVAQNGQEQEEHFRLENAPAFYPADGDDAIGQVVEHLHIKEDEAESRLELGAEAAERERRRA